PCTTDPITHQQNCPPPQAPDRVASFGIYGDARYRYGNFDQKSGDGHVNQFLAGGGVYLIWQKGMSASWIAVWPRLSATYYAPVSTDASLSKGILPAGIKADFLQTEFKTGLNLGPQGGWGVQDADRYPLRLMVTYDGSLPTTGSERKWES